MRSIVIPVLTSFLLASCSQCLFAGKPALEEWERPLEECWSYRSGTMSSLMIASDNAESIILPQTPATIIALSPLTGSLLWTVETGGRLLNSPFVEHGAVFGFSLVEGPGSSRTYRRFSIDSLSGVSSSGSGFGSAESSYTAGVGSSLAILDAEGELRLEGKNGEAWKIPLEGDGFSGLGSDGKYLLVWNDSGDAFLIDAEKGETELRILLPGKPSGSFSVGPERIYAGTFEGSVYGIDRSNGDVDWSSRTGGTIDGLFPVENGIVAVSRDNYVYNLSEGNGGRIWKRRLAGRVIGSAAIGDRFRAFLTYGTNEVLILGMKDGKPVNAYPLEDASHFVSAPVYAAGVLLVPYDSGIAALAPKGSCINKKDGR